MPKKKQRNNILLLYRVPIHQTTSCETSAENDRVANDVLPPKLPNNDFVSAVPTRFILPPRRKQLAQQFGFSLVFWNEEGKWAHPEQENSRNGNAIQGLGGPKLEISESWETLNENVQSKHDCKNMAIRTWGIFWIIWHKNMYPWSSCDMMWHYSASFC